MSNCLRRLCLHDIPAPLAYFHAWHAVQGITAAAFCVSLDTCPARQACDVIKRSADYAFPRIILSLNYRIHLTMQATLRPPHPK